MSSVRTARELRRALHRLAELSGNERRTAAAVAAYLRRRGVARVLTGIGGHGIVAVVESGREGPTVLLRAELDALPIPETLTAAHASSNPSVSHRCGHDGHSAILAEVAARLSDSPLERGRALALFQPAEETGEGATRVLDDPVFLALGTVDAAVAFHNLPGLPRERVVVGPGPFACASVGMRLEFRGRSAHAGHPERGRSPAPALAEILAASFQDDEAVRAATARVTVVGARLGDGGFGTTPGRAEASLTLRAPTDAGLAAAWEVVAGRVHGAARRHGLGVEIARVEPYPATVNDPGVAQLVATAARALGHDVAAPERPFPWSEDFGHLTGRFPAALFGLGAGAEHPALHSPDYDFPDALIDPSVALLERIVREATKEV